MPEIITYIVIGYLFCKTFHSVALKQNSSDVEHILVESLVVGYIILHIARMIPFSISYEVDMVGIALCSVVMAYLLGLLATGNRRIPLLDKLHIMETGNLYLWDDLMDNTGKPMRIKVEYDSITYDGMLHLFESYSNTPLIALVAYHIIKYDNNRNRIDEINYQHDATKVIVLDTSKANSVEITYETGSSMCKDIQGLCDYITTP